MKKKQKWNITPPTETHLRAKGPHRSKLRMEKGSFLTISRKLKLQYSSQKTDFEAKAVKERWARRCIMVKRIKLSEKRILYSSTCRHLIKEHPNI